MLSKNQLRKVIESANKQLANPKLTDMAARQRLVLIRESAYTAVKALQANDVNRAASALVSAGIQVADRSAKGYHSTFNKQADILQSGSFAMWHKRRILSSLPLNTAGAMRNTPISRGINKVSHDVTVPLIGQDGSTRIIKVRAVSSNLEQSRETASSYVTMAARAENMLRAAEGDDSRKAKAARTKAKKLLKVAIVAQPSQLAASAKAADDRKANTHHANLTKPVNPLIARKPEQQMPLDIRPSTWTRI